MADLHTNLLVQHRKYYSTTLFIQSLCRYRRHNTCLYIKTLLKAIIKSENPAMKISGNKVNLNNKELLSKMDGILVLTGTNTRIANMMHEDATNSVIQKNMNIYYTAMRKNWPLTSSHVNRKE